MESVAAPDSPAPIETWEVLDMLASLVQKSLVVYEEDEQGQGRYRLLETVRQYARERLQEGGEAEPVRGRHAEHFLQLAERAEPELHRGEQLFWSDRLEWEHDNLRAALAWSGSAGDGAEAQLRLAGALREFWFCRGYFREARQWAEEALRRGRDAAAPVRAKVLLVAGQMARLMGDYTAADPLLGESVALARAAGQQWDAAFSLFDWACLALSQGEDARATARAQECLALAREVGDPWLCALPLLPLGQAALHQGDLMSARSFSEELQTLARSLGDRMLIARAAAQLAAVTLAQGECEEAEALYREGLTRAQELADKRPIAACLSGLAAVAMQMQPERAARLFGAAEALREAMGSALSPMDYRGYPDDVAAIRGRLDAHRFAAAWAEGRAMPLEEAIQLALAEEEARP